MIFKGYCKTCALHGLKAPNTCAYTGFLVDAEIDYCSQHRRTVLTCSICGNIILSNGVYSDNHLICQHCFSSSETCKICRFSNTCEFETNPSPLPKAIQKEIRQGNMTAVTQVMNPERIHITCEKGCKCFDPEKGCLKQIGYCKNQEVSYND